MEQYTEAQTQEETQDVYGITNESIKFTFRKTRDTKDAQGNVIKAGYTRPAIEVVLPIPNVDGISKIIAEGGKGLEVLVSVVRGSITDHVRNLLEDTSITEENFPYDQATWDFLVNMPEAERRGRGIPKEVWAAFGEDYIAQMPEATGKALEAVTLAAKLLLNKFQSVKTNKPVLEKLKTQLGIYAQLPSAADFEECVSFLMEKVDIFLAADEEELANCL